MGYESYDDYFWLEVNGNVIMFTQEENLYTYYPQEDDPKFIG